jgi:PAS domain S-box-containing protein
MAIGSTGGTETIADRELFYKTIFNVLPSGILVMDRDLKATFANRSFENITGLKLREITGRMVQEFLPEDMARTLEMEATWILDHWGEVKIPDTSYVTPKGTLKTLAAEALPLINHDGTIEYLLLIVRDVTETRELAGKYQELFNDIDDIVLFVDREGRVTDINSYGLEKFGCTLSEIRDKKITEFIYDKAEAESFFYRVTSGETFRTEVEMKDLRTGNPFTVSWRGNPVYDSKGRIAGAKGIGRDITWEKRYVRELEENRRAFKTMLKDLDESYTRLKNAYRRLRDSERLKNEFLQNTSHELKTPLTIVDGSIELLGEDMSREERMHFVEVARRNIGRLGDLISNLVELGRMEAGRIELTSEPVDLQSLLLETVSEIMPAASNRDITIEVFNVEGLPRVIGDMTGIEQVLKNLLSNALKFNRDGGYIHIFWEMEGGFLKVSISDSGIGIPDSVLPDIFEKFYQVDGKSTRKYPGTGIGLTIAKKIVEMHGGEMGVESEMDEGSTFWFTLPVDSPGEKGSWTGDNNR